MKCHSQTEAKPLIPASCCDHYVHTVQFFVFSVKLYQNVLNHYVNIVQLVVFSVMLYQNERENVKKIKPKQNSS